MKLNEVRDKLHATHSAKIVGRGIGSGTGKTSGKGHKGQKARGTGKVRPGFEGGQNPIYRRMPKRGFNNPFAKQYFVINVGALSEYIDAGRLNANDTINYENLKNAGVIKGTYDGMRILSVGELNHALKCEIHGGSEKAIALIKAKGGSVEILEHKKFVNKKKQYSTK